jgi:RNA polymerase sigma-70 factor, ECF subfamily
MALTSKQLHFDRQLDRMQIKEFRKSGDISVLANLYRKYIHLTYGLCVKYLGDRSLAKTSVHEIFKIVTVESAKQDIVNFKLWLYHISKNYCLSKLGQPSSTTKYSGPFPIVKTHPIDDEVHFVDSLTDCIDKLEKTQKQCIDLFYKKNKSYLEIADHLGIDEVQVKKVIGEAKEKISLYIEEQAKIQRALKYE